ncbi:gluconokinase [Tessaracoccus antarcticus]|uniref:Gluconokinase n=1 Tax=Tessaracoccus antarcticus TaxID=2479848 RepID=A0A3M0G8B6_9ACTN|nr:gluconokinase [Tessaracoccus antarcticus]RMB61270.1 gluconokinase [Tessaracoccus antarcticus]
MSGRPLHLVVMGVAGTGKTTIGEGLAQRFGLEFAEGDTFHSEANKAKMGAGHPLTDEDRWPWLRSLRDWMSQQAAGGHSTVVACSALREAYRDILREAEGDVFFVHLLLPEEVNLDRLSARKGHYMHTDMLTSQLDTLEELGDSEAGIETSNVGEPWQVVADVASVLSEYFGNRLQDVHPLGDGQGGAHH